jgi:hypothetical protein
MSYDPYTPGTTARPSEAEQIDCIKRYVRARREAHAFRLGGQVDAALIAERLAGGYMNEAASNDHDHDRFERAIERCDDLASEPKARPESVWDAIVPRTREERRASAIRILNARFGVPSTEAMESLKAYGIADVSGWGEWIVSQADDMGCKRSKAAMLFDLLGPSEAFDGFVTALEDCDGEGEGE